MKIELKSNFVTDESGPTATEYAVCLAAILMVVIGTVAIFGNTVADMLEEIKEAVL